MNIQIEYQERRRERRRRYRPHLDPNQGRIFSDKEIMPPLPKIPGRPRREGKLVRDPRTALPIVRAAFEVLKRELRARILAGDADRAFASGIAFSAYLGLAAQYDRKGKELVVVERLAMEFEAAADRRRQDSAVASDTVVSLPTAIDR